MSIKSPPSDFPQQFQTQALKLLEDLLPISSAAFYLLDPDMRHRGVVLSNMSPGVERRYHEEFSNLDPLDARKFHHREEKVATIDEQMPFSLLRQTIYYQDFMLPHGHRYVADMFFRYEGMVVAVITLLRHESLGQYSENELGMLRKIQPFLEYTLNSVYMPKRVEERQSLGNKYQLTPRELDVLEHIIAGASNKQLAKDLNLGLATIKTHLLHIFQKMSVGSRAELLAKVISDLR
ncbi:response regulator transcription factor [Pseudoteredinibacter isoporae]|uniref:response regulator transcription factor n=1 Tax=Pseudoteredinibacter isoporae TaxID=570281 RepID=UPI003108ABBC